MLIKVGEIISKSIDLYKENWKIFLQYVALFLIPGAIIWIGSYALLGSVSPEQITVTGSAFAVGFPTSRMLLYGLIVLIAIIVSTWFSIAFLRAIAARYQKQEPKPTGAAVTAAGNAIVPVVLTTLLVMLIVLGGTLLLIVPGIIFSLWFAFAFYAVALDGKKPVESLKASKALVKGRWWGVFWRLFAPALVFGIAASVAQWIIVLLLSPLGQGAVIIAVKGALSQIVGLLFTPLTAAAAAVLYLELKKTPVARTTPEELAPSA